jgi:membrane fusion protein, heavy metal efflux system
MERNHKIMAAILAAVVITSGGYYALSGDGDAAPQTEAAKLDTAASALGAITPEQLKALGIKTEAAMVADAIPLGTVPAIVSLPPEARVAVTAPFNGAIIRMYVVEGQEVARGTPLALVKVRETLQIGSDLARGRAELGLAQTNANRLNQLAREGIIAGARADEANAALRVARVTVSENQKILAQAGAGASGQMTLRAPIGGRVSAVNVQTGGPVDGTTAPFVIDNTSSYMLDIQLPERLARSVRPGMAVSIMVPQTASGAESLQVGGNIVSVAPTLDPLTRSVMAKARIGASPGMVAGKSLMVTINGNGDQKGVFVPASAVTHIGEKDYVFVLSGKRFEQREVVLVATADGKAVLSTGLKAGEKVATTGIAELKVMMAGN